VWWCGETLLLKDERALLKRAFDRLNAKQLQDVNIDSDVEL
jgi:hypothetical protein